MWAGPSMRRKANRIVSAALAAIAAVLVLLGAVGVTSTALSRRSHLIDSLTRQNEVLREKVDGARRVGNGTARVADCKRSGSTAARR